MCKTTQVIPMNANMAMNEISIQTSVYPSLNRLHEKKQRRQPRTKTTLQATAGKARGNDVSSEPLSNPHRVRGPYMRMDPKDHSLAKRGSLPERSGKIHP